MFTPEVEKREKIKLRACKLPTGKKAPHKNSHRDCRFKIYFHDKMSTIFSYRHAERHFHPPHHRAEHNSDTTEKKVGDTRFCEGRNQ